MSIVPFDSATDMSSIVWVTPDGDDWLATGVVQGTPSLWTYNSSAAEPFYYHLTAQMLTHNGTIIPVFINNSNYSKYTATQYIDNGSACSHDDLNSTSYPTGCMIMMDRSTGNWVDWQTDSALISFMGGQTPDCTRPEYPPTYLLLVTANTVRYGFGIVGAGMLFDTVMVLVQAMFFFTFLAMLVSVVTTIPKIFIR